MTKDEKFKIGRAAQDEATKADDLEDADTEGSTVLENKKYAESIQASRDNIKVCKRSSLLGVEKALSFFLWTNIVCCAILFLYVL